MLIIAQRVAHEFAQLKKTKKYTGSSYRFPISNQAVTSSLAVNAAEISPLLQASEDRVKALENEVRRKYYENITEDFVDGFERERLIESCWNDEYFDGRKYISS